MANVNLSPDMNLPIPIVGVAPGPEYAQDVNNCLTLIDSHDHTPGFGVQITPAGININTTFNINNQLLANVGGIQLTSQVVTPSISSIYESGTDLFFVDGLGNNIQITQNGGIAGSPGSISNLTPPASAAYIAGSSTFVWQSGVNIAANMDFGSAILRNLSPNSTFGLTLSPPSLSSNYTLTLPLVPAVSSFLQIDTSGTITGQVPVTTILPSNAGTQGQILRQSGSGQPIFQNLLQNIQTKTSTYAISNVDDVILVSGGVFTVTLPDATTIQGKQIIIKKTDASLTNIITIATSLGQTIDGASTRTLNTISEIYTVVSDGANWQIIEHETITPFVTTTSTITATTTNPTKGATPVTDNVVWRRNGQFMEINFTYYQTTAGVAGLGAYLFTIPSSLLLDSSVNIATGTIDQTHVGIGGTALGVGFTSNSANAGTGVVSRTIVLPFSTSKLYMLAEFQGGSNAQSESWGTGQGIGFATNPYYVTFSARLPIAGWSA